MRIHCTDRNHSLAKVHFSLDDLSARSISGRVRGPFCQHSRTLPSNAPVNQGCATVVDPCYWTSKLPFLYEAQLQLDGERGRETLEFRFGLRWCVPDGVGLRVNANWFVARCVSPSAEPDLEEFRAASAALWMTRFCVDTCARASECGVLVACAAALSPQQATRIDAFPAVFWATMPASATPTPSTAATAPTHGTLSPDIIPLATDAPRRGSVFVADETSLASAQHANTPQFVLRQRTAGSLGDLRRECDLLQRDVAAIGQFAGYVVQVA